MSNKSMVYRFISVFFITFVLAACSEDGPMEQAGEKADQAIEDAGNAVEDSCEKAKEKLGSENTDC